MSGSPALWLVAETGRRQVGRQVAVPQRRGHTVKIDNDQRVDGIAEQRVHAEPKDARLELQILT